MKKKPLVAVSLTVLMLSIPTIPSPSVEAWVYPDGSKDAKFEMFGPRADKLLIKLYSDDTAEYEALKAGDIDITDWPLSKTAYDEMTQFPYNDTIHVVSYGPEYGLFILDLNSNNNQYLGNPPDPTYPNPVADRDPGTGNPLIGGGAGPANDQNPMSDINLRRAIAYLIDRPGLIADPTIGAGFGYPMYTTMPPRMEKYRLDVYGDPDMPWAWDYNPLAAAALLDANGFPINTATGYRFWDRNTDGVEQADEYVEILFYIRSDHPGRNHIGTVLVAEMAGIDLRVNTQFATSGTTFVEVMVNKDFHIYTGYWRLDVDPDFLINWSWDYYWHPGFCYNYGGHNHPDFNALAAGIMYANDQPEAVMYAMMAQEAQCREVLGIPLYCVSGNKAYRRAYTGPEAPYTGSPWLGIVNTLGYGIDNRWSFLNMHPEGHEVGNGEMTIRWGFKVPAIQQLNPIYASLPYDWNLLRQIYEPLIVRNASDLGEFLPWLVEDYALGTYEHPTVGTCSKIRFALRPDVTWHDGTPLTTADVYFTFVELKSILTSRVLPDPWWWSNVENSLTFLILDPYNFEVLLDVKSYWALSWMSRVPLLPKHIWKPIAETGDPQADQPDPDLIGSGPWRFDEYNPIARYVRLVANRPGSIVHDITSPQGYWRYLPINLLVLADPTHRKKLVLPSPATEELNLTFDISWGNLYRRDPSYIEGNGTLKVGNPFWIPFLIGVASGVVAGLIVHHLTKPSKVPTMIIVDDYVEKRPDGTEIRIDRFEKTDPLWITIQEDIVGGYFYDDIGYDGYPYKSQLPSPDIKVDIKDLAYAAKGFGAYPGHKRWQTVADINEDYKIDIKDIAAIAKMFGWVG